jgi:hypothetical protein
MSLVTTSTRDGPLGGGWFGEAQQPGQHYRPSLMHHRPHDHLGGFQVQVPRLAAPIENDAQQLVYFARDFLLDGFGRFFSSGDSVSVAGRARQIFSLTSNNS